uniref:8.9 kDa family member n=1 Tax=Rhipicephalus zambeziensis TaxID=60191 RepID=A0A224Y7Z3_9ACAR
MKYYVLPLTAVLTIMVATQALGANSVIALTFDNEKCYYKGQQINSSSPMYPEDECIVYVCQPRNQRMLLYGCPPPKGHTLYDPKNDSLWPQCCNIK